MPNVPAPAITSPLSLSRMRSYLGTNQAWTGSETAASPPARAGASPTLKRAKRETDDILAQLGDLGLDQLVDRSACSP